MRKFLQLVSWMVVGGLLIGAVGLVVFATPLLGNRALIVRSGSMEPTIAVGDIVIVRAGEYQPGEAIAYTVPGRENPAFAQGYGGQGMVVTHRIVEVKDRTYITKGDANAEADSWLVSEADILGKELFVVPWVGKVLAFAKTKAGFTGLVLLPALVVILSEARVIWRELRRKQTSLTPTPRRRFVDGLSARLAVIVLMVAVMTPATWALYSDSATSANNVFAAAVSFGTDHVVISEVQLRQPGTGNADKDFIELYNPTGSSVDISNWRLRNRTSSGAQDPDIIQFPASTSIAAHGYFLWANSNNNYAESVGADAQNTEAIADNNSIALTMSDGTTIIDGVGWGSLSNTQYTEGTVPANLAASKSYERKALSTSTESAMELGGADEFKGNGLDSDNNSTDFIIRDNPEPQNSGSITETP